MIKLPNKLKIGAHDVKICYPYQFKERIDFMAQCDNDADEIRINAHDPGSVERPEVNILVSLMHELYHRIDNVSGHHVFDDNEKAICGHTEMMVQVLLDNPEFVELFLQDNKELT